MLRRKAGIAVMGMLLLIVGFSFGFTHNSLRESKEIFRLNKIIDGLLTKNSAAVENKSLRGDIQQLTKQLSDAQARD